MHRLHPRGLILTAVLLAGSAAPLRPQAQQQAAAPRTMVFTTTSTEARDIAYQAAEHLFNINATRAAALAKQALALDPNLAMARAIYAWSNPPELDAAEREQELNRAIADAARASTAEVLGTTTIRAIALNRNDEANLLLDAMIAYLPDDPVPPYLKAIRANDPAQAVANLEAFTRKWADFAPAYNILAYQRWAVGDREGALTAVQEYARLAPNIANSHDSYAEILQFVGRLPEAMQHYQRAIELDPAYSAAPLGVAEVHMLMGHPAVARETYAKAVDVAVGPGAKLTARASGAMMYVLENKPKDALREIGVVAAEAEQQNLKPQAAAMHRLVALIEALYGDRNTVAPHLAKAAELGGPDVPAQHRLTAITNALIGRVDLAKPAAQKYAEAVANGTTAQKRTAREVNAIIAVAENDLTRAQSEVAQGGAAATLGKAVVAQALARAGRKAEAQTLKTEILSTGTATGFDVLARARVQKL